MYFPFGICCDTKSFNVSPERLMNRLLKMMQMVLMT